LIAVNRWRITFQNSGTFSFHIIELPPVQGPAEYAHDEQHQHGRQGNEQVEDVHVSADVSFAMGQGALVARAQADAVVVSSRLADLVRAHSLARKSMRVIRQNLVWAAVYNAVCIPLALAGWLPPWAAGLGMASSSLGVILNSMRLAR